MSGWLDRAEDLLYDGEEIVEQVRIGSGGVVVTTHRVMAFTPDGEGANFRDVDRPNVVGVAAGTSGEWAFLERAIKALVAGGVLLVAGQTVSLDSMVEGIEIGAGAGQVGMGGMLGMLQTFLSLMAQLDELLTLFGALALLFGAVVLGVYAWSREDELVVSVAGDGEDLRLPAPEDAEAVAARLEAVILPDGG
jgi:hypothetical protein